MSYSALMCDGNAGSSMVIENDRQYSITQTQAERLAWALERLQRNRQDAEDSLLAGVCEDAVRSRLGDLRAKLREY